MYVYLYVCMYVHTYVCMYVSKYVCTYVCMYVCVQFLPPYVRIWTQTCLAFIRAVCLVHTNACTHFTHFASTHADANTCVQFCAVDVGAQAQYKQDRSALHMVAERVFLTTL